MITIKLQKSQVPGRYLQSDYRGRKFRVDIRDNMMIPADAGLWSGGSREVFHWFQNGMPARMPFSQSSGPFDDAGRTNARLDLLDGHVVTRRSWFCGKDTGLTFYCSESTAKAIFGVDKSMAEA